MSIVKPSHFIRRFSGNNLTWDYRTKHKVVYLTFDDGPIPEVTPWVLRLLKKYNAKATFFCVGENISKHHDIFKLLLEEGHAIGNHTYNHLKGWLTDNKTYFSNIKKFEGLYKTDLFRPPYGKIKPSQIRVIKKHYKIIMWSVLSMDYDKNTSAEQCIENVMKHVKPGSIIVFHDSLKAFEKLKTILPEVLNKLAVKEYEFKMIKSPNIF